MRTVKMAQLCLDILTAWDICAALGKYNVCTERRQSEVLKHGR